MYRPVVALLALAALATPLYADTWQIDPAHTTIEFSVRHMMISNVSGLFTKFSGTAEGDPKAPAQGSVKVTIDAASIDTREPKRDEHLKSPDFLDVAKYPTITFVSKKVEAAGGGKFKVTGDLTLHGVTKEVVLDVDEVTGPVQMGPATRAGAHATTTINRKDYGINFDKTMDSGGLLVGNEIKVDVSVEGVKK